MHRWQHLSQVHAVTLAALRRTTLSNLHRVAHSNTARHTKRPRDGAQHAAHRQRKTEGLPELEVRTDLQYMEIPVEDMGHCFDWIVPPPPPQSCTPPLGDRHFHGGAFSAVRVQCTRGARAVQLFGRLAIVETHTLWYFGHHCCLVVGFDALGIWHFWMFTLFHPFLLFCAHFFPISTTSTLFLG